MKAHLFITLFLISTCSFAQDFKLAGINYTYYPARQIKNAVNPDDKISYEEINFHIAIPFISKNKKNIFINKLADTHMEVTTELASGEPSFISGPFHTISYNLAWIHVINKKWMFLASAGTSVASDLRDKLSSDDFLFEGTALARHTFNEHWGLGVGVAYLSLFGKPLLLPVVEASYERNLFKASFVFPISGHIIFSTPNKKLKYGFETKVGGNNYNLEDGYYLAGTNTFIDKVRYSRINIGPMLEWNFWRSLHLGISTGITGRRVLELEDNNKNLYSYDAKPGPYFNIGFFISPPVKKNVNDLEPLSR
jgi:hypothetical protein